MKLSDAIKGKKKGVIRKWQHYFPIYDSYFEKIQNQPINLLEIGVDRGGSLFTWKEYFPKALIVGIDNNSKCKEFEDDNIKVFIGDQADSDFLKSVNRQAGPFDIIIDDGGHMMYQQITSFKTLFPLLTKEGYYIIEDWHTSYLPKYLSGEQKTVDFLKGLIDGLNYWAIPNLKPTYFSKNILSLHFYSGIVIIKKGNNQKGKIAVK